MLKTCNYCSTVLFDNNHRIKFCSKECQKLNKNRTRRKRSAERKAAGICPHCTIRKLELNKSTCKHCREINNKAQSEKRKKFIALKLCRDCGEETVSGLFCELCSVKAVTRSKKHYLLRKEAKCCTYCNDLLPNEYPKLMCNKCLTSFSNKNLEIKREVLFYYGRICVCCSENNVHFLALDHINNDGAADRRKKRRTGINLYKYLRYNSYPPGFQTMCHNCNIGKATNGGICPHVSSFSGYGSDYEKTKNEVLTYYGKKCACCGVTELVFLSIDHIDNQGAQHRQDTGGTGYNFYRWLIKNKFPDGFQTLCMSCNLGKQINKGVCPHNLV